jgi:hypothetical protein
VQLRHPPDRTGLEIDVIHQPTMLPASRHRAVVLAWVVEPRNRLYLVVCRTDGRGHKNVVVPHDRRTPTQPRHVDFPGDVLRFAPRIWQAGVVGHVARLRPSEFGPLLGSSRPRQCGQHHQRNRKRHHSSHYVPPVSVGHAWHPARASRGTPPDVVNQQRLPYLIFVLARPRSVRRTAACGALRCGCANLM